MKHWSEQRVAGTAGAELVRGHPDGRAGDGPTRVVIDSREVQPGDLFVGIPGEHADGGEFAAGGAGGGGVGRDRDAAVARGGGGRVRRRDHRLRRRRCRRSARWRARGGAISRRT